MSAYYEELLVRLINDGPPSTARWFLEMVAEEKILLQDFSALEWWFWDLISEHWRKNQPN
jgi:hypothetical protein